MNLEKHFLDGLKKMGLPPLPWGPFDIYLQELQKWNQSINLTAITQPLEIVERHFLDSLSLVRVIDSVKTAKNVPRETFLDIGTGAGLPGIPIKIAFPEFHVTLLEPIKKRVDFLKHIVRKLSLRDIPVLHKGLGEGESIGWYGMVTSRATFKLDEFLKLASSQVTPGGIVVAMKSVTVEVVAEIKQAESLLQNLGLLPFEMHSYTLPFTNLPRQLLIARKIND